MRMARVFGLVGLWMLGGCGPGLALQDSGGDRASGSPRLSKAGNIIYNIEPHDLEALRVAGNKVIVPDDDDRIHLNGARLAGSFELCIDENGHYERGYVLHSTGVSGYDAKIARAMKEWVYHPYVVDGVAVPVCSAITFVYSQR